MAWQGEQAGKAALKMPTYEPAERSRNKGSYRAGYPPAPRVEAADRHHSRSRRSFFFRGRAGTASGPTKGLRTILRPFSSLHRIRSGSPRMIVATLRLISVSFLRAQRPGSSLNILQSRTSKRQNPSSSGPSRTSAVTSLSPTLNALPFPGPRRPQTPSDQRITSAMMKPSGHGIQIVMQCPHLIT